MTYSHTVKKLFFCRKSERYSHLAVYIQDLTLSMQTEVKNHDQTELMVSSARSVDDESTANLIHPSIECSIHATDISKLEEKEQLSSCSVSLFSPPSPATATTEIAVEIETEENPCDVSVSTWDSATSVADTDKLKQKEQMKESQKSQQENSKLISSPQQCPKVSNLDEIEQTSLSPITKIHAVTNSFSTESENEGIDTVSTSKKIDVRSEMNSNITFQQDDEGGSHIDINYKDRKQNIAEINIGSCISSTNVTPISSSSSSTNSSISSFAFEQEYSLVMQNQRKKRLSSICYKKAPPSSIQRRKNKEAKNLSSDKLIDPCRMNEADLPTTEDEKMSQFTSHSSVSSCSLSSVTKRKLDAMIREYKQKKLSGTRRKQKQVSDNHSFCSEFTESDGNLSSFVSTSQSLIFSSYHPVSYQDDKSNRKQSKRIGDQRDNYEKSYSDISIPSSVLVNHSLGCSSPEDKIMKRVSKNKYFSPTKKKKAHGSDEYCSKIWIDEFDTETALANNSISLRYCSPTRKKYSNGEDWDEITHLSASSTSLSSSSSSSHLSQSYSDKVQSSYFLDRFNNLADSDIDQGQKAPLIERKNYSRSQYELEERLKTPFHENSKVKAKETKTKVKRIDDKDQIMETKKTITGSGSESKRQSSRWRKTPKRYTEKKKKEEYLCNNYNDMNPFGNGSPSINLNSRAAIDETKTKKTTSHGGITTVIMNDSQSVDVNHFQNSPEQRKVNIKTNAKVMNMKKVNDKKDIQILEKVPSDSTDKEKSVSTNIVQEEKNDSLLHGHELPHGKELHLEESILSSERAQEQTKETQLPDLIILQNEKQQSMGISSRDKNYGTSKQSNTKKNKQNLPKQDEWKQVMPTEPNQRPYYYNRRTRETKWKLPPGAILVGQTFSSVSKRKKKQQCISSSKTEPTKERLSLVDVTNMNRRENASRLHSPKNNSKDTTNTHTIDIQDQHKSVTKQKSSLQRITPLTISCGDKNENVCKDRSVETPATEIPVWSNKKVPDIVKTPIDHSSRVSLPSEANHVSNNHGSQKMFCMFCGVLCEDVEHHLLNNACGNFVTWIENENRRRREKGRLETDGEEQSHPLLALKSILSKALCNVSSPSRIEQSNQKLEESVEVCDYCHRAFTTGFLKKHMQTCPYIERDEKKSRVAPPPLSSCYISSTASVTSAFLLKSSSSSSHSCPFCKKTHAKGDQLSSHLLKCPVRKQRRNRRISSGLHSNQSSKLAAVYHKKGDSPHQLTKMQSLLLTGGRKLSNIPRTIG